MGPCKSFIREIPFMLRCVQDLNLNQTGVFWFVKNGMVHIQGRFAFSQVSPGGAAFGSVLLVEPLNGGLEWHGERVCLRRSHVNHSSVW